MKLQFSPDQDYQLQAVKSVIDLFEGQPLAPSEFTISLAMEGASITFTEKGIGNNLVLPKEQILSNVQTVQINNKINPSPNLVPSVSDEGNTEYCRLNFTIEMETGTGKTYTFLRTIYELNKVYGFQKFVIVVPSVAIREGTMKNLQITHDHFQGLYGNIPLNYILYDRWNLTGLRNFARANTLQILVINIDSFTKDNNVINTMRETGVKPIDYIQITNPIVIIDEPQNFETDIRRAAIQNLNPLCTLRYSATHRNLYNLVYSLNPVQAYDLGLVKQIEVDGITRENNYNNAFIHLKKIAATQESIRAKVTIYVNAKNGVKSKNITVNLGDDLWVKSQKRDVYQGFILTSISKEDGYIEFSNGVKIYQGQTQGGLTDEIMKFQIERTIKHHFDKVRKYRDKKIKVLSLFFIDRVANYRTYDANGNPQSGKFAEWFEDIFNKFNQDANYQGLIPFPADQLHNGYFASDRQKKGKDQGEIWLDSKEKNTRKDQEVYALIMQDKERLLSLNEPLQFIFSHSALREGWDNPNVFQICTLNETKSSLKKRQEIGRGLRLAVDSNGQRVADKQVNILTMIVNQSYQSFAETLQQEIEEETSVDFTGRIKNVQDKVNVGFTKKLTLENFPLLFEIWQKINQQTRYSVRYETADLINLTVAELQDFNQVPLTRQPLLESHTVKLEFSGELLADNLPSKTLKESAKLRYQIPDVYRYIQSRVNITRQTIFQILVQSGRYGELEINPQMFLDNVVGAIKRSLNKLLVEGVRYQEINGKCYEMTLFKSEEIERYLIDLFTVIKTDKTVYNYVPLDSNMESDFGQDCEVDENIKCFFKLPRGFQILTPIGHYIPDWAVVFEGNHKIYFVAETRSSFDRQLLRDIEQMKNDVALLKTGGIASNSPLGKEV